MYVHELVWGVLAIIYLSGIILVQYANVMLEQSQPWHTRGQYPKMWKQWYRWSPLLWPVMPVLIFVYGVVTAASIRLMGWRLERRMKRIGMSELGRETRAQFDKQARSIWDAPSVRTGTNND